MSDPALTALRVSGTLIDSAGIRILASALQLNNTVQGLWLHEIGLCDKDAGLVAQQPGLTLLNVSNNRIGPRGASELARALSTNTNLRSLWIGGNQIGAQGAGTLIEALGNTACTRLDLCANRVFTQRSEDLRHSKDLLFRALARNTTLRALRLANNDMGDDHDARRLSKALQKNTTLTILDLGENRISDNGAGHIADLLRQGSLTALGLSQNRISLRGVDELFRTMGTNTILTVLDLGDQTQPL